MSPRLARTLFVLALGSMPLAGCNARKTDSAKQAVTPAENVDEVTADKAAEAPAAGDMPAPTGVVALKEGKMGRAGAAQTTATAAMPAAPPMPPTPEPLSGEDYTNYGVNPMTDTAKDNLSTFAIDVDTASYAIARRKIMSGQLPPPASVRVEEMVNYFTYDYAPPTDGSPFAVHMDAAPSPFHTGRTILRVGVQAKKLSRSERKPANLVFLVNVSGSMESTDKLPLAKRALRVLVDNLNDGDTVSLVTYAGNTRVVLEPTGLDQKGRIMSAIEDLNAGGSTAMASGLELAYDLASRNLRPNSSSRVIVMSDGDANVGNTTPDRILETIAGKVKEGVTLSTIGFGMGNYKDTMMERLADKGNGNYYYIDTFNQAKRVFQEQLGGTLEVVAKDVKIQVELDKKLVKSYRLIGYENRDIADRDFRNDRVDAGEIGAGHSVTALYELELAPRDKSADLTLATVRIRAKAPRGTKASEKSYPFDPSKLFASFDAAPKDLRFATAVMATAEVLRGSPHAKDWKLAHIEQIAAAAAGKDDRDRQEFLTLLDKITPLVKVASR